MTNSSESIYPTDWHLMDVIAGIECRQLSDDTYELRSATTSLTLNKEGFEIFRRGNVAEWRQWLRDNNIVTTLDT